MKFINLILLLCIKLEFIAKIINIFMNLCYFKDIKEFNNNNQDSIILSGYLNYN